MYEIMNYLYSLEKCGVQRQTNFEESYYRKKLTLSKSLEMIISYLTIITYYVWVNVHFDMLSYYIYCECAAQSV